MKELSVIVFWSFVVSPAFGQSIRNVSWGMTPVQVISAEKLDNPEIIEDGLNWMRIKAVFEGEIMGEDAVLTYYFQLDGDDEKYELIGVKIGLPTYDWNVASKIQRLLWEKYQCQNVDDTMEGLARSNTTNLPSCFQATCECSLNTLVEFFYYFEYDYKPEWAVDCNLDGEYFRFTDIVYTDKEYLKRLKEKQMKKF